MGNDEAIDSDDAPALNLRSPTAYGQAFVDVYDQWYHDVSDADAAASFIARRVRASHESQSNKINNPTTETPSEPTGEVVIEFGVGTGRLAGPMGDAGLSVVGIDASLPMLSRYVSSNLAQATGLAAADMRSIPLRPTPTTSIAAVVIAFNTLFNVVDDDGHRLVLSEARRLVAEGGVVILEALTVDDLPNEPTQSIGVRTVGPSDVTVSATQIRSDQTMTGQHIEVSDTGVRIRPWMLRWLNPTQLDHLASTVGLQLVERFSSWDENPYLPTSTTHVSVYRAF